MIQRRGIYGDGAGLSAGGETRPDADDHTLERGRPRAGATCMDPIRAFAEFALDFEKTLVDDDWSRLERHFHEDAVYRVENSPFACELTGRRAILEGMRRSLDGFDRRCDSRQVGAIAPPRVEGSRLVVRWRGTYRAGAIEPLEVRGTEVVEYRGDRIASLLDSYEDADIQRFVDWLGRCGRDLDPSYAARRDRGQNADVLTIYHAPRTRSVRVIWLLQELGDVPHQVVEKEFRVPLDGLFGQDTPSGKFPTLVDGALVLFESGAIVQYLLDRYGRGRLQPAPNSPLRGVYYQWLHFAEASGCVPLNLIGWYGFVKQDDTRFRPVVDEMHAWAGCAFAVLERQLGMSSYLLGNEFTAADIMVGYTVHMARVFGVDLARFPRIQAYFARLCERPGFQRAMAGRAAFDSDAAARGSRVVPP